LAKNLQDTDPQHFVIIFVENYFKIVYK